MGLPPTSDCSFFEKGDLSGVSPLLIHSRSTYLDVQSGNYDQAGNEIQGKDSGDITAPVF